MQWPLRLNRQGGISVSEVHHDSLYVGGSFLWIDGQTQLNRIGRWTGTTLEPVGDGFNGTVETLKSIDGILYAGGNFTRSGETTVNRIARFNEETRKWEPIGEGFNNSVRTLSSYHGDIVAGGYFSMSGDEPVDHVARWETFDHRINDSVSALAYVGEDLYDVREISKTEQKSYWNHLLTKELAILKVIHFRYIIGETQVIVLVISELI